MFHGVDREDIDGDRVRLTLTGWDYTPRAEMKAGAPPVTHAAAPCAVREVPRRYVDWDGTPYRVVESAEAGDMVTEHCGAPYTVVWQGRGWTVEIRSGYPLWQTTA
jgi:hypothetical protein